MRQVRGFVEHAAIPIEQYAEIRRTQMRYRRIPIAISVVSLVSVVAFVIIGKALAGLLVVDCWPPPGACSSGPCIRDATARRSRSCRAGRSSPISARGGAGVSKAIVVGAGFAGLAAADVLRRAASKPSSWRPATASAAGLVGAVRGRRRRARRGVRAPGLQLDACGRCPARPETRPQRHEIRLPRAARRRAGVDGRARARWRGSARSAAATARRSRVLSPRRACSRESSTRSARGSR